MNQFCDFDTWTSLVNHLNTSGIYVPPKISRSFVDLLTSSNLNEFTRNWKSVKEWMLQSNIYFTVDFCMNMNRLMDYAYDDLSLSPSLKVPLIIEDSEDEEDEMDQEVQEDQEDQDEQQEVEDEDENAGEELENNWMNVKWQWKKN